MPKIVEGIEAKVILDISDVQRGVAQFEKEYKKMAATVGQVRLRINDKEVRDLGEKSFAKAIKNFQGMADKATEAALQIKKIDKAIQQLQSRSMTLGQAGVMAGMLPQQTGAKLMEAAEKLQAAQFKGGEKGIVTAQKEYNKAKNEAIRLLRLERTELDGVVKSRMQEVTLTAVRGKEGFNVVQRTMLERVQTLKSERKELATLMILHKKKLTTDKDLHRAQVLINNAHKQGIELSGKYNSLQLAAAKAEQVRQSAMSRGNLAFKDRIKWFAQLRLFWGMYRGVAEVASQLLEKDQAMARALRTSRFGGEITNRTMLLEKYSEAMNQVSRQFGTSFEAAGEALYQLGSAGLKSNESLAALNSTMQLIVGTEGDVRDTTKAVASIYNNFGDTMTQFVSVQEKMVFINSTLANTWRDHQVEIGELTQGLSMSSQMAVRVGVKFEELAAMLGVLNTHMVKSGRAGRALQNIWARMAREPIKFAHVMGVALDPTKPIDFMNIMKQLHERMREGNLSAAELGDMFGRLGLRGAPAFAALVKHWDEVGEAMKRNLAEGRAGLEALEKEMTTRFTQAAKRLGMNWMTYIEESEVVKAIVNVTRDAVNESADILEGTSLGKRVGEILGQHELAMGGGPGRIATFEDIEILKQAEKLWKKLGWETQRYWEVRTLIFSLESAQLQANKAITKEKERQTGLTEDGYLTEERLAAHKKYVSDQETMSDALTMGNAQKKLEILKTRLTGEEELLNKLRDAKRLTEAESETLLTQNNTVKTTKREIAEIETFILSTLERQRKAIAAQVKKLNQYTMERKKQEMWMDDPRLSAYGRMKNEEAWIETEKQLKLKAAAEELKNVQQSLTATNAEKETALRAWIEKEKTILLDAEQNKANIQINRAKQSAQDELQHRTTVWQGGGGMGGGMLGAHSSFLQRQKSEQEKYEQWKKSKDDDDKKRYQEAKEERIAGGIEVARATVGSAAEMMLQLAQQKKKYFKYYQMLSIAETVIATGQGVMQAYAQAGPYLGSVFAALITALGAMKVSMIMKQKPPEYAQGGVFDGAREKRNRGAQYATGGVTSTAAYAMLGDNASGKELVIPAEHIDSEHTAGYTRNAGAPVIMNVVTNEDVAVAMNESAGRNVTVNTIGRDMRERRSTYRQVQDSARGR